MNTNSFHLTVPDLTAGEDAGAVMAITSLDVLQAVARGWCHAENAHKTMDVELAVACSAEVSKLLADLLKPVAWAVFAPSGNIRLWSSDSQVVRQYAKEQGLPLTTLYTIAKAEGA